MGKGKAMTDVCVWWKNKGVRIFNKRLIDLIGQNLGKVPVENLFTEEELSEIGGHIEFDDELITLMDDDGIKLYRWSYENGEKEIRFFIE